MYDNLSSKLETRMRVLRVATSKRFMRLVLNSGGRLSISIGMFQVLWIWLAVCAWIVERTLYRSVFSMDV